MKNRSIMDNILICQDLVHNYHRQDGPPRYLLKLDLQKVYDTVDWTFLVDLMKGLGFPEHFVSLIYVCLSTAKFSFNVNCKPEGYFAAKRGMRQGDPMSPYLFVLVMEYLSRLLLGLDNDREFKYHAMCRRLKMTHLSFADDLMMICRGDHISAIKMKMMFDKFSATSGLKANLSKSCIFFSGVPEPIQQSLLSQLGMSAGNLLVRYLGVPLISSSLSRADCQPRVDKIRAKLSSWTSKYLSYAGRCQLLKSVVL